MIIRSNLIASVQLYVCVHAKYANVMHMGPNAIRVPDLCMLFTFS